MTDGVQQLRQRLAEGSDLRNASGLMQWDQQTMMPPNGGPARADALATLGRLAHEQFISEETGKLLDAAAAELNGAAPDSDDASLVRVVRRNWDKATRVPSALAAELARAASLGQEAWAAARANSDFKAFVPYLERNLELAHSYVECFDGFACPYDALLDDYDPMMTTAQVAALFTELRSELVPLIATLAEHADAVDDACLHGTFDVGLQRTLVDGPLNRWASISAAGGWMTRSIPLRPASASNDVRITTRWHDDFLAAGLYGAMHECGHGLYEAGIPQALQRTPLGRGASLAVHESQSRLWENMVGRGRAYCGVLAPRIDALFGNGLEADALYRAVNKVQPSHIRVEADEATYGLHIVLRFELEQELIEGDSRSPICPRHGTAASSSTSGSR